jgi:hypothetical protein
VQSARYLKNTAQMLIFTPAQYFASAGGGGCMKGDQCPFAHIVPNSEMDSAIEPEAASENNSQVAMDETVAVEVDELAEQLSRVRVSSSHGRHATRGAHRGRGRRHRLAF